MIATVLLVAVALVLAVIIFFWARSFIGESISKGDRAIEESCDDVIFRAEAIGGSLTIVNEGNIPIYSIEIKKKQTIGEIVEVEPLGNLGIATGESSQVSLPSGVASGDTIVVTPILLGETETHRKTFVCNENYGKEITVG